MNEDRDTLRDNEIEEIMPMIPLRGLSIFPYMVLHFDIGREKSISALEKAMMMNQTVFLSAQKNPDTELPTRDDFYQIGTIAKIKQMLRLPGDTIRVLVEGVSRGRIEEFIFEVPYFKCRVTAIKEEEFEVLSPHIIALMRSVLTSFEEYLNFNPKVSQDIFPSVASIEEPGRLADVVTSHLDIKIEEKQEILEAFDVEKRLELVNTIISKEIEILQIENTITKKVKTQINKSQREYYLKEQLRVIQEELGVDEDVEDEIYEWLDQLKKLKLSPTITEKVEKEIKRLKKIQPSSAEGRCNQNLC
jgi:ATP-dependent Lon protease